MQPAKHIRQVSREREGDAHFTEERGLGRLVQLLLLHREFLLCRCRQHLVQQLLAGLVFTAHGLSLDPCLLTFRVSGAILEGVAEATPKATKVSRALVRLPRKAHRAAGATANDSKRFGQAQKCLAKIFRFLIGECGPKQKQLGVHQKW